MFRVLKSGYAFDRIEAANEFVRSFPAATEILIVGASREAVDDFVRKFASSVGATFGLHRFSLTQLAARLALPRLSAMGAAPNSSIGAEALAARAAYEAAQGKNLKYFAPIADFPGFSRAVSATISDLRSTGVSPETLQSLNDAGPDNAALLQRFEEQMKEAALADRVALLQSAIAEVQSGAELVQHPLLLLDVPVHSALEKAFVKALAATSHDVLLTCPAGDRRTLENLNDIGDLENIPVKLQQDQSSLVRLRTHLFADALPPQREEDERVVFFSAPGEDREAVEIARRILAEAEKGVPFDRVAIVLRSPENYAPLIEAALRRAGIPAYFSRGARRPDPSGRALLALLACAAEALSARRFAEYLSFAQVPDPNDSTDSQDRAAFAVPEDEALIAAVPGPDLAVHDRPPDDGPGKAQSVNGPELEGTLRAPWKWEELLVDAAVIGSKGRWARRLKGLEAQCQADLDELENEAPDSPRIAGISRKLRNLQHLSAFALPVIDALAALPALAKWGEWIDALENLVPRVLRDPDRVLAVLADMRPMSPVGAVPLAEVRNVLQHWLANLQQAPPESRYGSVLVATPDQVRGRCFEVVFVPGLAERIFPQKFREDPLLLDHLRRQLSSELPTQPDRSQQERLLLHLAVGAASRRLYLSYPRLEVGEGRPRVPSFYALDVARSITGLVPDYKVLARNAERSGASRLAWPAPRDPASAIDDAEYDLASVWPLLTTKEPSAGRLAYVMRLNSYLARSLRSRWSRWQEKWSQHDGLFTKRDSVITILAAHRLNARPYSVSALQNFAVCPYRFLLSAIYRLEPREELTPLEEMDPLTKGALFHRMQAEVQRELKDKGLLPVTTVRLPQALPILDKVIKDVSEGAHEELAPAIDRVWLDSIESIRADLRLWLEKVAEQDRWTPLYFEFGFGFRGREGRDPASLPEPVRLPTGELVHGVVDLIERGDDGVLRVTDHKTGKDRTMPGLVVGGGEYLQPVIYGMAIEAAMKTAVNEGRFFFCTTDGGFSERIIPLDANARSRAETVLQTIDEGISTAFLVPAPREDACQYCDFQEVCGPYEEVRVGRKQDKAQLIRLRDMRELP